MALLSAMSKEERGRENGLLQGFGTGAARKMGKNAHNTGRSNIIPCTQNAFS
jgi:hypothetical protein